MRVLDLFSGIGGFSLGLERAGGFETVAFCEQDTFCQRVLAKHWPDVPCHNDVRKIDATGLGGIDLICGGFPCQPWSVAGQQRGAEDDRDLWPVMASLIEKLRPQWVIGENVRGFVNEPLGLQRSLSDLEGFGYQAVPFVIPACAVDAPHRRDRVWIVANANGTNISGNRGSVPNELRERSPQECGRNNEQSRSDRNSFVAHATQLQCNGSGEDTEPRKRQIPEFGKRGGADVAADTDHTRPQRRKETGHAGNKRQGRNKQLERCCDNQGPARRTQPGMGGVADGVSRWLDEPDIGRVATGVKDRSARLKALGNAVVPQVVEQIGRAILAAKSDL